MAEEKTIKAEAVIKIVGVLTDVTRVNKSINKAGHNAIGVNVSVRANVGGVDYTYPIEFYTSDVTAAGAHSKLYDTYCMIEEKFKGKKVEIEGTIDENRFYSTYKKEVVSTNRLKGRFISEAKFDTPEGGSFEVDGIYGGIQEILAPDTKELTGYAISIIVPNYNNTKMSKIGLHLDASNTALITGRKGIKPGECFGWVGSLKYTENKVVKEDKSVRFGAPIRKTYTTYTKLAEITSVKDLLDKDDKPVVFCDKATVSALLSGYKAESEDIKAKSSQKGTGQEASAPASGSKEGSAVDFGDMF